MTLAIPSSEKIKTMLLALSPRMDPVLLEYTISYFDDVTNDFSLDALIDFLFPILKDSLTNDHVIHNFIQKVAAQYTSALQNDDPIALKTPFNLPTLEPTLKTNARNETSAVDIAHTTRHVGKSIVDRKKLQKAEAKLALKRAERNTNDLYQSSIPVWNPDIVIPIMVNQAKPSTDTKSKDVKLENFDISFSGKVILKNANLSLTYGRRYGMVGMNGVGKSTLLRAISHGELILPGHINVLHVEQEIAGDDTIALKSVLDADVKRVTMLEKEKTLNDKMNDPTLTAEEATTISAELKLVYAALDDMESDKAESRASSILSGLGFSSEQQSAATCTFSGGWRMRLALARALFCRPDLLLADEVTNYLDFPAVVWLEQYFQAWNATLLVVSHDKSFLDAVSTDILHLHHGQLDTYRGNFTTFVATRTEKVKNQLREYESQLQYRQHLQAFIDRWRYNAKRSAQAQSKIKILEKLPPLIAPPKDDMEGLGEGEGNIYFTFPSPEKLSPPILQMENITFGYVPEKIILKNVSFDLQMDSKIAIVGPNGAGKSTLIHLLTGDYTANTSGDHSKVSIHSRLRIGFFSQHHVDQLDLGSSPVQFLQSKYPGQLEEEYRKILARYGLSGMTALQPIGTLSGGQKSRVVFAQMAMGKPHVLVLDEPTNHLDMDSIDALSKALVRFTGGLVIVSHDERFLDAVCKEVWVCQGGGMSKFDGRNGCMDGIVKQYKDSLNIV